MAAIFGKRKLFSQWARVYCKSPSGTKIFDEIAVSCTVKCMVKCIFCYVTSLIG